MKWQNQRKAFSMLIAIVVIVLMATVAMLIMSISGKTVRETTAQFQREQAALLAKSYTEYAIMAVTANDRNSTGSGSYCLSDIDGTIGSPDDGEGYNIRIRIAYIGLASEVNSCAGTRIFSNTVNTTESPLNIIVDAYVEYKEPDHPDSSNAPYITYHKRTLQKI